MAAPQVKRMVWTIVGAAAAAYLGLVALVYLVQEKMLFFPTAELYRSPGDIGWDYEDIVAEHGGGKTHGWYIPAEGKGLGVILFSHGNAGNIADRLESVGIFRAMGLDTLVYDYGGYGESDGKPSESRCYQDVRAMWKHLTEDRGVSPNRIILFGRSLGGAVTADLAAEVRPAGVILESTFTSVPDVAQEYYRFLPVKFLTRLNFSTKSKVQKISSPLFIIHSPQDSLIPFHHGQRLFELAHEPKQFMEIRGDHNEGFVLTGQSYLTGLKNFITPLVAPPTPLD